MEAIPMDPQWNGHVGLMIHRSAEGIRFTPKVHAFTQPGDEAQSVVLTKRATVSVIWQLVKLVLFT